VESAAKLQKIIDSGMKSRTVASTQMNADSSRSHSVFVITVRQKDMNDESKNIFAKGEPRSSMFANIILVIIIIIVIILIVLINYYYNLKLI
jgi:hypothetical protein